MARARARKPLGGRITCNDGFAMSVQASREHACFPRDDIGPYSTMEVGYPSAMEPLLMPYRDVASIVDVCAAPPIYVQVPARVIQEVVAAHAGLRHDSAALPPMVELDNGYEWAAAAPPPSTTESEPSAGEAGVDLAPTSVIHLGAPPPPPPTTTTPMIGALTPPLTLRNEETSPIVIEDEENLNDNF